MSSPRNSIKKKSASTATKTTTEKPLQKQPPPAPGSRYTKTKERIVDGKFSQDKIICTRTYVI